MDHPGTGTSEVSMPSCLLQEAAAELPCTHEARRSSGSNRTDTGEEGSSPFTSGGTFHIGGEPWTFFRHPAGQKALIIPKARYESG
jgi:hypothetical protein